MLLYVASPQQFAVRAEPEPSQGQARAQSPDRYEAFLSAIHADPDDDTHRLVFADWLDDHGESDRAEFIRVQVELARLPKKSPNRAALEKREKELEKGYRESLVGELPKRIRTRFRRGLLHLSLAAYDLIGRRHPPRLADLAAQGWVESVTATDANTRIRALLQLPLVQQAGTLDLGTSALDDVDVLTLARQELPPPGGRLRRFLLHSQYEELYRSLRGEQVSDEPVSLTMQYQNNLLLDDVKTLAGSPHLARVTDLELSNSPVRDEGVKALAESPHADNLLRLNLRGGDIGDEGAQALARSKGLRSLRELDVSWNRITPAGLEPLLEWAQARRLSRLVLQNNPLGDPGAVLLARSEWLRGQTYLDLAFCGVGDAGAAELASSPRAADLETISFLEGKITDAGAALLAGSPHFKKVKSLALNHNPVTDAGMMRVLVSEALPALQVVQSNPAIGRCDYKSAPGGWTDLIEISVEQGFTSPQSHVLSNEAVRLLCESPLTARVKRLRIVNNRLDTAGCVALAGVPFSRLEVLELSETPMGDEAADALAGSPHLKGLKKLIVWKGRLPELVEKRLRKRFGAALTLSR
jgi:uncharacterized protein (TIGR02996 family)